MSNLLKYKKLTYSVYLIDPRMELPRPHSDLSFTLHEYTATEVQEHFVAREPARLTLFSRFLSQGYIGCYLIGEGGLMSFGWGMVNQTGKRLRSNNHFPVGPGEGHIFFCYTYEAFRGHQLYASIIHALVEQLRQRGAGRIWIDTNDFNVPAQKGILKAGFRIAGVLTNYFLFKRRFCTRLRLDRETN